MKILFIFLISLYLLCWVIEMSISFLLAHIRGRGIRRNLNSTDATEINDGHNRDKPRESITRVKYAFIGFINGIEKRCIYQVSKIPSHTVRMFFYRHIFKAEMSQDVVVYSGVVMRKPSYIRIGRGTVIGNRCELDGRGGLIIGSDCNLSSEVHIWTAQHDPQSPDFAFVKKSVTIGDHCWISSNTVILPGVKVGDGVVLSAGAVLSKDAEPYGIYAGVPAKKIGDRNQELTYHFDGGHDWFL